MGQIGAGRRIGAGVGMAMAVSGRAQTQQILAPVRNGASQAEQWMFMEPQLQPCRKSLLKIDYLRL